MVLVEFFQDAYFARMTTGRFKLARNEKAYPPSPSDLGIHFDSHLRDVEEDRTTTLRACKDTYIEFLKLFGKAVYGKEFIKMAHGKALSDFLPTCMEAFLVVAYANGYDRWKEEGLQERDTTRSNPVPEYKFTALAKGAKACEGLSEEGVNLYDDLYDIVAHQRAHPILGIAFEKQFMVRCAIKPKSNGKRKHRNDWDNAASFES